MDIAKLKKFCLSDESYFRQFGDYDSITKNIFCDNKSPILAVAHLDYVADNRQFYFDKKRQMVWNGALDDRLGVYTLLELLPKMGIRVDVLLTTDEEVGMSTAFDFETRKEYNWMFQFDRHGTDLVFYQYGNNGELVNDILSCGFNIGIGSFSDISYLGHLGISGFNVGTGYHLEHTKNHHGKMQQLESQLKKFSAFYCNNKDKKYPYIKPIIKSQRFVEWAIDDKIDYNTPCIACGITWDSTDIIDGYCPNCSGKEY